ncbi:hypothetical protein GA0115240_16381, partial [Streptomyces sp. DvalAA-14]
LAALQRGTRKARAEEDIPTPDWPDSVPRARPLPTLPRPTRNTP